MGQIASHSELHAGNQHVAADKILPAQEAGSFPPPPTPLECNGFCISLRPHCLPICLLTKAWNHATLLSPGSTKLLPMSQLEARNSHFSNLHRAASFSPFKSQWKCRLLRKTFLIILAEVFFYFLLNMSLSATKIQVLWGQGLCLQP